MGSIFGNILRLSTFGESHGPGIGLVLEGVPAGLSLSEGAIQNDLDRRRPGQSAYTTARKESDTVEILSGLANGKTLGTPIGMLIRNQGQRSKDYSDLAEVFRPGHADYTYFAKYGTPPQPGGGRSSGRETAARVAAGAVARLMLAEDGVDIRAYTVQLGKVRAEMLDLEFAESHPVRAADPEKAEAMAREITEARSQGDSVGGVVEVMARGVPAGWGEPVFDKLDARLGGALFSIGGVKAVSIGAGFEAASRLGSENNDQITARGFLSNNAGGVLGGISSGQPIVIRLAIKPTPSISLEQKTIGLDGEERVISIKGRHDPCLCPRIAPVAEAMTALVLADAKLVHRAGLSLKGE